jgi:signal transduction histidine kinase
LATTAFRLALAYLGLFLASVLLILGLIYWSTAGLIDAQTTDTIEAEITGLREQYRRHGLPGLVRVVRERAASPHTNSLYLIAAPDGTPLAGNLERWPDAARQAAPGWIAFDIVTPLPEAEPHPARAATFVLPGRVRLLVGRDLRELEAFEARVVTALAWALVLTVGLGLPGGWLFGRSALRRIDAINRTTGRIMAGDLAERVPVRGSGDELDRLAGNLNAMLDRIEQLMGGMRRTGESIAHDLRTPLSRLRSRLEIALMEAGDEAALRAALADGLAECDALLATFGALLRIAQAESGALREDFEPVPLADLARGLAELYEPAAEDKGLALEVAAEGDPVVSGSRQLLSQAVANLLDNAVKYTPSGGRVTLAVAPGADGAGPRLSVADSGPGIPEAERERVLQRFVRLEPSRSTPGNGLGLSLVDAVARLHGCRLELADNDPGLRATLAFPAAASA